MQTEFALLQVYPMGGIGKAQSALLPLAFARPPA